MQINELNHFVRLFDIYGNLLPEKQFELLDKFLNYDIGESEIAEMFGSSRQSVHDAVSKAKKQLLAFEEKCGILKKQNQNSQKLFEIKQLIETNNAGLAKIKIDELIENL